MEHQNENQTTPRFPIDCNCGLDMDRKSGQSIYRKCHCQLSESDSDSSKQRNWWNDGLNSESANIQDSEVITIDSESVTSNDDSSTKNFQQVRANIISSMESFPRSLRSQSRLRRNVWKNSPLNDNPQVQVSIDLCAQLKPNLNQAPSKKQGNKQRKVPSKKQGRKRRKVNSSRTDYETTAQTFYSGNIRLIERVKQPNDLPIFGLSWSALYSDTSGRLASLDTEPQRQVRYVASCSRRDLVVYKLKRQHQTRVQPFGGLVLEYCYTDADPYEDYFACEFAGRRAAVAMSPGEFDSANHAKSGRPSSEVSFLETDPLLLCAGGIQSVIKVIDCRSRRLLGTLKGHGAAIHDLKISPVDEWLLLSASIDQSCRLWNLRLLECGPVAIFGGHAGHCDFVISISWHLSGERFASGGVDNTCNVWDLTGTVAESVAASHCAADRFGQDGFTEQRFVSNTVSQFPIFSTKKVHTNCVDCVQFVGDLLLSKSIEHNVRLWFPKIEPVVSPLGGPLQPTSSDVVLLRTFDVQNAEYWFVRFALDPTQEILAAGNAQGVVYLFSIGAASAKPFRKLKVTKASTIRYLSFSPDGSILLAATDDGSIYRWSMCDADCKRKSAV
jgi:polycomb protein EED